MWSRRAVTSLIVVFVGWWLFSDTYHRHAVQRLDENGIRFAHFGSYEDYEFWQGVIADFERQRPQTHVRQEYVVGLGDQYNIKMRQQILSDTLPDIALIQFAAFHELAEYFEELSAPPAGQLEPTGLEAFRVGGVLRALPVSGGNLLIYANRTCFERATRFHAKPVPLPTSDWTVADFLRTAEALTCDFDRDGRIDQFGFWLPRWVYYLPFIWSFGAELTDPAESRWTFRGSQAECSMRFYRQLATGDRVCPREEEVAQLFQDTGFLTGRTAMCVNGPWFMPFLTKTDLAESYIVAPMPKGPAGRGTRITWDGVVMKRGLPPNKRATSWQFIEWVLSREVQDSLARSGRALPARRESLEAFVSVDESRRRPFVKALAYSRLQPNLPRFSTLDRIINRRFGDAADPTRAFRADALLGALAGDHEIVEAFQTVGNESQ